ncbi:MAG: hypothetical protein HYS13_05870 [Planctomycetia bacterium]|nr:hypothetical protein [Planctomycetia bacterium]
MSDAAPRRPLLERDEYVEQAYFFRALADRMQQERSTQDLLVSVKEELLSTTKLPLAIDYLAAELKLHGALSPAMTRLKHYFTAFQTYLVQAAEAESGRFDMNMALEILYWEAKYRSENPTAQGSFLYQFEALCRNRLSYAKGLDAMAEDPIYDDAWRAFMAQTRRQLGMIDIADLIYIRSEYYAQMQERRRAEPPTDPILFGEREGKIALANRRRDPLLLFSAMQRHLNYPAVPRPQRRQDSVNVLPGLVRRMERLEMRLKLIEEEQKGGIDLSQFMLQPPPPPPEITGEADDESRGDS